ncbi:glyoxylate/hydroxypyruvate reductase A [Actimicrobium sp. CCI2.3]|uniref:2-hydroxyacid dehydrogenase n=1 Tax=Actimicrobium sp. CCI2.3 TaxID=3048616 RepID=UPI002AB38E54|nr:glyoxylate/hydroxypyruvate reductase A [Actimicrobium sp. CCI2.3]MDY7573223.1 glyoxylate/hydroxypyruvate reductase A [Actimicrobium sp. CCI2.3]MEB0022202.1 glyoxylate/hydroxypyruvate reductase A [Actimicrobium sp. CCI2.3]
MQIIYYADSGPAEQWLTELHTALPLADVRVWHEGDTAPADYAVVWKPPAAMLQGRIDLKAIFNLGAGVDAILQLGDALSAGVPVVRLDDAGMAVQMADYVSHAVLRYFRRFDEFDAQARDHQWRFLKPRRKEEFSVGILGMGVLGTRIAEALLSCGFPVRGWSRSRKEIAGVQSHAGADELAAFLAQSQVLVCVLPLTPQTTDILDRATLAMLPKGAYLINVARGAQLVEQDLLDLLDEGHLGGATLDVFREEPLPSDHPFWNQPRITITPHISALTLRGDSVRQIAAKIKQMERGQPVAGLVDRTKGY